MLRRDQKEEGLLIAVSALSLVLVISILSGSHYGWQVQEAWKRIQSPQAEENNRQAQDDTYETYSLQDVHSPSQTSALDPMAGIIGVVPNNSGFASFTVREWLPWMTEAVVLHYSGVSIPELRVRFGKSDHHLRNIMNTEQAKNIVLEIERRAIKHASDTMQDRINSIKSRALDAMSEMLDNTELKAAKPFSFWDASRKTLETVSRMDTPQTKNTNVNITQNILSSDVLERLRSAPTLQHIEVPRNVEYLGAPPSTGRDQKELHGRGVHTPADQSEERSSLSLAGSPPSEQSVGLSSVQTSILVDEAPRSVQE